MINYRYKIGKMIGEGRSKVFLCEDFEIPGKQFAIKIMPRSASEDEQKTFGDEYNLLNRLDHPSIIKAFNFGTVVTKDIDEAVIEYGSKFIITEYFPGETLSTKKKYSNEELHSLLRQLCAVLYYQHQSAYIYYDLKPDNILISERSGKPILKLIDFGFAKKITDSVSHEFRGTSFYIAPEILKKEKYDHRVDLYSLGIILYELIYNRYPFEVNDELEIYKAHIETEFEYPDSDYPDNVISTLKKLLNKTPEERFDNSLQVIDSIGITIDKSLTQHFSPVKLFSNRTDAVNILNRYFTDTYDGELFSIKGFEGAGKSFLLEEISRQKENAILINNERRFTGLEAIKIICKNILLHPVAYNSLSVHSKRVIEELFKNEKDDVSAELLPVLSQLKLKNSLIFLFDDVNLYDELTREFLFELIRSLQINNSKIVLSESSDAEYFSDNLNTVHEITLTPFTDKQVRDYVDTTFAEFFPKEKLVKIILLYADLLPGSIYDFIGDALMLEIMKISSDEITFSASDDVDRLLQGSNEDLFRLRLSTLSEDELNTSQIIACFEMSAQLEYLTAITTFAKQKIENLVVQLMQKNVLSSQVQFSAAQISSESFKRFIYSTIKDKESLHKKIAETLISNFPESDKVQLYRHYKLAGETESAFEELFKEIKHAEEISAFSYKKSLLEKLGEVELEPEKKELVLKEKILTGFKMGDFSETLHLIKQYEDQLNKESLPLEILNIKGVSLINTGELEKGKKLLLSLLNQVESDSMISEINTEIAYAEFDLSNYSEARKIAENIIEDKSTNTEVKGRCYNLLGMCDIYESNNFNASLHNFLLSLENYKKAELPRRIAGAELNIGNVYHFLNDFSKAEEYWQKAIETNKSIGNLEQEGMINLSFGIYYYEKHELGNAIEKFKRSENIFSSLGYLTNYGIVLTNLANCYTLSCEYESAFNNYTTSINIHISTNNLEEQAGSYFAFGRFAYIIGDKNRLLNLINELSNDKFSELKSSGHKINLEHLRLLYSLLTRNEASHHQDLIELKEDYLKVNDNINYIECCLLLAESYTIENKLEDAVKILNYEEFIAKCEQSVIFLAEREYLLGEIAKKGKLIELVNPLEYYERAFEILKDASITELTWKVLLRISEIYFERGNIQKAKKPFTYSFELFEFISDNFTDPELKLIYTKDERRINAIERFKFLREKLYG